MGDSHQNCPNRHIRNNFSEDSDIDNYRHWPLEFDKVQEYIYLFKTKLEFNPKM